MTEEIKTGLPPTTNGKRPEPAAFERAWNAFQRSAPRGWKRLGGVLIETIHGTFLVSQYATFVDLVTPAGTKYRKRLPLGGWHQVAP